MIKLYFIAVFSVFTFTAYAGGFYGTLSEVYTPNIIIVDGDNAIGKVEIQGVDFGEDGDVACTRSQVSDVCDFIYNELKASRLAVEVTGGEHTQLSGDIVYQDKILSVELVRNGYYRVDYSTTKARYMMLAEKEAMCAYRGIWSKYRGDYEMARKCQM